MLAFTFVPILLRFGKFWEQNQKNFTASQAEYIKVNFIITIEKLATKKYICILENLKSNFSHLSVCL